MNYIKLIQTIKEHNKLIFNFETSLNLFTKKSIFVEYETINQQSPDSINNVIFAGIMAPLSWASGSNLIIPCLDKVYFNALKDCKVYFERWRKNKWSFAGSIIADLEDNNSSPELYGMLFSGGLDATSTFIKHKDKKPMLFTIFGADIPLEENRFISLCKERFEGFAGENKTSISFISTDFNKVITRKNLQKYSDHWYGEVAHSLLLTSVLAPITYKTFREIFIASSYKGSHPFLWGSDMGLDNNIRWARTRVVYDNDDCTRSDKIRLYLKGHKDFYKHIRVCWAQFQKLNCSKCEKCLRTMLDLLANNISPKLCNFEIDNKTLMRIKRKLINPIMRYSLFSGGQVIIDMWKDIRNQLQLDSIEDMFGSKDFFRWFANFETLNHRHPDFLLKMAGLLPKMKQKLIKLIQ